MLQELRLFFTSFTGELPNSIGNLRQLSTLDLHNSEFNGSIPNSISQLNQLQYVDLSLNGFTGLLGENFIGSLSPLEFLDLSYNQLQGRVPVSIFEFSRLYHLGLLSNSFSGAISLDMLLHKLRNLSNLYLSDNRFSITTESTNFALYPQLRWLALSSCNLTAIPSFLRNQSELEAVELARNQIHGKIPNWIPEIGNGKLNTLNLSYNFLEDPDQSLPDNSFNSLSFVLDLRSNYLKGRNLIVPPLAFVLDYSLNNFTTIPDISSQLGKVFSFSLSGNRINGEIPTWICEVHFLTVLDLSNNNLSGPIPPCMVSDLNSLQILNLGGNILEGIIPDFPTDSCNLEVLELDGNKLEGELPYLANCTNLEVLNIGNNQLHGTLPSWLGSMSNLRVLVLRSNQFYGAWGNQEAECNFPVLQIIDISSNNFSGRLPKQCFSNWKAMMVNQAEEGWKRKDPILGHKSDFFRYYYQQRVEITSKGQVMELGKIRRIFKTIDFSNNEFDGEIPEIIGNLTFLYTLDFSRNALTGPIPTAFGNLTHLESLDLSHNKLTGEIPSELARLSFLSYLNLSFNKLEGKIPSGNQFENFEPSSFKGNIGLCGYPLSRCNSTNAESPSNASNSKGGVISVNEFDWVLFLMTFLGFVVGASMVIGPQYFWKKGREWDNERINRILNIT
ncbi:receptor-like protein 54 [Papaver somniferum]|uniref:receptor-like protein 54 n=1 Tax=Papaver somniferum TaxID=3469 RepID=UPI000E7020ED|nr:receptor-like protein 54 [Papaver somniferum]